MGLNHEKLALVLGCLAFSLDMITTAVRTDVPDGYASIENNHSSRVEATRAFIVIAFIMLAVAFILLLEINYADLKGNKIAEIVTICLLFVGGLFCFVTLWSVLRILTFNLLILYEYSFSLCR